ncbi:MAG: cytochrome c3 family protein [Candidatus Binatia bacterium]
MSKAHALFGKQCALCHEPFKGAPEQLCLKCHAGPIHNAAQAVTPPCISCHVEHKGQEHLAQVANGQCVSCHADVKLKSKASPLFAKKVTSFTTDHPEFALSVKSGNGTKRIRLDATGGRQADQTTLTFPHDVHLKADLKSPKGPVQLLCKDCHAPADNGRQIAPIVYEEHCQSCHQLAFSPDMPNRFAPHAEPSVVHGFLVATYAERRSSPPPAAKPAPEPQLPTGRLTRPVPSVSPVITSPTAGQSVAAAEKYLYTVTCDKCHAIENPQARIPTIARVAIPQVWLPHALFPHRDHRALECIACHESVQTSKAARDVNLPSIQICQQCHRTTGENVAKTPRSATTNCVSCHVYHDKSKDADWLGTFSIQRILTEGDDPKGQAVQGTKK